MCVRHVGAGSIDYHFRPAEFEKLDALLRSGVVGEKLSQAHRLLAQP